MITASNTLVLSLRPASLQSVLPVPTASQRLLKEGHLKAASGLGPAAYLFDSRVFAGVMVPFSVILEDAWSNKRLKSALWGCTETLMLICE